MSAHWKIFYAMLWLSKADICLRMYMLAKLATKARNSLVHIGYYRLYWISWHIHTNIFLACTCVRWCDSTWHVYSIVGWPAICSQSFSFLVKKGGEFCIDHTPLLHCSRNFGPQRFVRTVSALIWIVPAAVVKRLHTLTKWNTKPCSIQVWLPSGSLARKTYAANPQASPFISATGRCEKAMVRHPQPWVLPVAQFPAWEPTPGAACTIWPVHELRMLPCMISYAWHLGCHDAHPLPPLQTLHPGLRKLKRLSLKLYMKTE